MSSFQTQAKHYKVLGVTRETPWAEIKDAHRQLIRECHPDKFSNQDPLRAESEERAKQINNAFQELTKSRKTQTERAKAVSFTKVDFSPDSPKRPRAKTVERMVVVKDGVVYSVKKMRRVRNSRLKAFAKLLVASSSAATAAAVTFLRGWRAEREASKAAPKRQPAPTAVFNVDDFAWAESQAQTVVHFNEGKRLVRNGSFRS